METLLVILRRWRLSAPAMVLALGIGSMAFWVVPPAYEDSTQVLFLGSPKQPGEKDLINPYLQLASTLVSTADVIRLKVTTAQTTQELAENGFRAEYEVALDQSTPAPVLIVTTKDADPTLARRTGHAVVTEIQRLLEDVQQKAGAPPSTWVSSTVISGLPEPQRQLNESLRPAIGAGVGILAIALFGIFLFEGRRGPARRQQPQPQPMPHHEPVARPRPDDPIWTNGLTPRGLNHRRSSPTRPNPTQSPAARPPAAQPLVAQSPAQRQVTLPPDSESRPIWQP